MANRNKLRTWLWLVVALLFAGGMWNYVFQIWSFGQFSRFSDLYAPWWATHEVVLHHRDPYTVSVAHEIQTFIYGAPSVGSFAGDPEEIAGGFAYPIHATFFLVPTIWLDFPTVQILCAWIFGGLVAGSVLLWLHSLKWRPSALGQLLIVICVLGSFPAAQAVKLRNLTVLAAFLIAWALAALSREHLVLAGALLAAATFKPQFVVLLIPWLGIWTFADWKQRRALATSFASSMVVLILCGEMLVRGWVAKFVRIASAYHQYTFSHSLLDLWLPRPMSWVATCLAIALAGVLCFQRRKSLGGTQDFARVCAWMLSLTVLVIPTLAPHAQLLLVPGYIVIIRYRKDIWQFGKWPRLLFVLACVLPLWESCAALALNIVMLRLPIPKVHKFWLIVLYPSPLMPLGIVLILGYLLVRNPPLSIRHA